ncbi:elongation factor 4 [Candidatus Roizmanbacteria bacterium RIFCSPLOWO2_01_FULL_37_12]|uniref:Elongation factor 4 n=1 Tax=Candidatus Roizmanbacteria bacterium RIFCSPLOWO2_01_FULL_37_12 TaxID=1802056 RepID=A0A1F7IAD3_9BACT|nr:MAG: elongation factor 4 [Candidatus Roizmanbacteria bacterium RIFCSPLOWO2_01_FULL_37_12]
MNNIRNFAIIAHIDHGKSTLADRFLEITGVVTAGKHEEQLLDRNPISRERGITIKLAPVRMEYRSKGLGLEASMESGNMNLEKKPASQPQIPNQLPIPDTYILNLIDTPGHVDFSYEVDRTLSCVEGVILLVDATQGIQAQTIANAYKAIEKNLVIIPVINKIDLANAYVETTKKQLVDFLGVDSAEIFEISAKTGKNVDQLLESIVKKIPPPLLNHQDLIDIKKNPEDSDQRQALIFDSYYDPHRGVITFIRIFSGNFKKGLKVSLASNSEKFEVLEVGYFLPELKQSDNLGNGEIGYVATNLKDIHQVRIGDTVVDEKGTLPPLLGYKKVKPMVFASIFPTDTGDYLNLKKALEKLYLSDSSLEFSTIYSKALGTGFRVGFLGLLHAEVVRERLEREFNLDLVLTPPNVDYRIDNNRQQYGKYLEPIVKIMILTPEKYLGSVMSLCQEYRSKFVTMDNKSQVSIVYEIPLSEMISGFYDNLKSVSSGYASVDWEFIEYREVEADKLSLLLNGETVEEFSEIIVKQRAFAKAQFLVKRLKELIPRQQYEVKIQAQYKGKIIASERIAPFRKDVTKKLYGGDRSRKDKLLDKQKEGKKKLKMIGRVEIPKEAFLKLFKSR